MEMTSRITRAKTVAIPPQLFFIKPYPSILQKAEYGNILTFASPGILIKIKYR